MNTKYISEYLYAIQKEFQTGKATEHTYRPHLKSLLESLAPNITAINEPKKDDYGMPDFIVKKNELSVGCIETKDFGERLNRLDSLQGYEVNQLERYRNGSDNLVYTDYIDFIFYKNTQKVARIRIAHFDGKNITPIPENFDLLCDYLIDFYNNKTITIKSASKLAEIMARKARLVADVIRHALGTDGDTESSLHGQLTTFQHMLIHDISINEFADVYAQTIAYGMFAARLNDKTPETFSRAEAATLIPKTNPFLRNLFGYIAGPEIDTRILWDVDNLAEIFSYTDVAYIMRDFGRATRTQDPIIHFYETFLEKYNPKLRKQRGVFYTPTPVVDYIVRAVDSILKTDFGLPKGLADSSKITTKQKIDVQGCKRAKMDFHRVQILDPATGTGTFLAEAIKCIHEYYKDEPGLWTKYVDENLLPRLHGFELLMASYAMAHLKLDLVLRETGYVQNDAPINKKLFRQDNLFDTQLAQIGKNAVIKNTNQRVSVYLTNSLEEADPNTQNLFFAQWLSNEAREANRIKEDIPVMCVIGNPPYSVSSSNNNNFARDLIEKYKTGLNERNIQPLSDDYIKFIALGQHYIEKNGMGILAFITNNSFLDGVIHRQMRRSLLETFDKIYILNLHGNTRRKEKSPDGSKDENVFDIMTGVSINIFVKTTNRKSAAKVLYFDLYGKRDNKYKFLSDNSLEQTDFKQLKLKEPEFFFVDKDFSNKSEYDCGFSISDIFMLNACGITTHKDNELISFVPFNSTFNNQVLYRPFDMRYINYDLKAVERPRYKVMQHMLHDNIAILTCRQQSSSYFRHAFITKNLCDLCTVSSWTREGNYVFPLYTYFGGIKESNLDQRFVSSITEKIGRRTEPLEIFDYIYGVLHSLSYREKYREFLKIDFPKIPYPKNNFDFKRFAEFGTKLRELHLMEYVPESNVKYRVSGNDVVDKIKYDNGRVYINDTQYFDNVSETAWNFFIGGYQPAQKWLKDRRGRKLSLDDIQQYKNIVTILDETDNIMKNLG